MLGIDRGRGCCCLKAHCCAGNCARAHYFLQSDGANFPNVMRVCSVRVFSVARRRLDVVYMRTENYLKTMFALRFLIRPVGRSNVSLAAMAVCLLRDAGLRAVMGITFRTTPSYCRRVLPHLRRSSKFQRCFRCLCGCVRVCIQTLQKVVGDLCVCVFLP